MIEQLDIDQIKERLGWLPDLPSPKDWRLPLRAGPPALFPSEIDLRLAMPPVYDQSALGACAPNASADVFRFVDQLQGGANVDPSRLALYYDARALRGWQDRDSGSYIRDNLKVLAELGAAPERLWPYNIVNYTQKPPIEAYNAALSHQAIGYFRLDHNLNAFKSCLADGFPFIIGSTLFENFTEMSPDGLVPMPSGSEIGGHAYVVCGYRDSNRLFICKNSWGLNWGKQGFFFMPYDYLTDDDLSADPWTIRSLEELAPEPEPIEPVDPNFYSFSAVVEMAKRGKLVLSTDVVLPNLKQRRVIINGSLPGKIKHNEEDTLTVKGAFDPAMKGQTVGMETV
jgi:C1A family cysteine protease